MHTHTWIARVQAVPSTLDVCCVDERLRSFVLPSPEEVAKKKVRPPPPGVATSPRHAARRATSPATSAQRRAPVGGQRALRCAD